MSLSIVSYVSFIITLWQNLRNPQQRPSYSPPELTSWLEARFWCQLLRVVQDIPPVSLKIDLLVQRHCNCVAVHRQEDDENTHTTLDCL